jgi:hypothetical protein
MAWSGGNFTRANPTWATDASLGIGIEAGRHDAQDNDFTTGIDQCLNKTGQNSMTGDLNLGGYKAVNAAAGTAAAPAICAGNDVNTGMYSSAADEVSFATNGVVRTTIDSSGNVGLGTGGDATPEGLIAAGSKQLTIKATNTYAQANLFSRYNGGGYGSTINLCFSRGTTAGSMTLPSSGDNLGGVQFAGADGTNMRWAASIKADTDSTPSASSMPGRLTFSTTPVGALNPVERMRIASDGTVGIGGLNDSTERLRVVGSDTTSSNFSFAARSSTTLVLCVRNDGRVGIGTGAPSNQLTLSTDSAAKPTTNTWTISSDQRIKTNVQPYAKGLAEICQVNPITYDYNGKAGIPAGPGGVSILAQELQPVFPECVGSYRGKLEETDEEETDILNYNGHAITFALINAVKELNAKVQALEAQLEAVTEV